MLDIVNKPTAEKLEAIGVSKNAFEMDVTDVNDSNSYKAVRKIMRELVKRENPKGIFVSSELSCKNIYVPSIAVKTCWMYGVYSYRLDMNNYLRMLEYDHNFDRRLDEYKLLVIDNFGLQEFGYQKKAIERKLANLVMSRANELKTTIIFS